MQYSARKGSYCDDFTIFLCMSWKFYSSLREAMQEMGIQRWAGKGTLKCSLSNTFKIYSDLHLGSITIIWHAIIYILP